MFYMWQQDCLIVFIFYRFLPITEQLEYVLLYYSRNLMISMNNTNISFLCTEKEVPILIVKLLYTVFGLGS